MLRARPAAGAAATSRGGSPRLPGACPAGPAGYEAQATEGSPPSGGTDSPAAGARRVLVSAFSLQTGTPYAGGKRTPVTRLASGGARTDVSRLRQRMPCPRRLCCEDPETCRYREACSRYTEPAPVAARGGELGAPGSCAADRTCSHVRNCRYGGGYGARARASGMCV